MSGYVYRGNEPWTRPQQRNKPGPKPGIAPFDPTACGTMRGYRQHRAHGQEQCRDCLDAQNDYRNANRNKQKE